MRRLTARKRAMVRALSRAPGIACGRDAAHRSLTTGLSIMADPMKTLAQYVNAFNRSDVEDMAGCSRPRARFDGLPPHAWTGATAPADWHRDVMAASELEGASDHAVTMGEPRHREVTGGNANVVVPTTMSFLSRGARLKQTGSTSTAALRKIDGQWRIAAWAWTKGPRVARE
jgi:hypothetical protein